MELVLVLSILILGGSLLTWVVLSIDDWIIVSDKQISLTEDWNLFGLIWNAFKLIPKGFKLMTADPLTPIQREIREEEREIEELRQQKADMKRLEALKAERERLFEEVNEEVAPNTIDPLPNSRYYVDGVEIPMGSPILDDEHIEVATKSINKETEGLFKDLDLEDVEIGCINALSISNTSSEDNSQLDADDYKADKVQF